MTSAEPRSAQAGFLPFPLIRRSVCADIPPLPLAVIPAPGAPASSTLQVCHPCLRLLPLADLLLPCPVSTCISSGLLNITSQDRTGARAVSIRLFRWIPHIRKVFADGGHTGKLIDRTRAMFGWAVEIVKRNETGKFVVLPKRRVVERTFAWLANYRRLNHNYEINPRQSEAMIKLDMIHLLLKFIL
jgi:putative transposase